MSILPAHKSHPRRYEGFKYVYPVLSRRSHGISIGVNVNPDKVCNFDCIYCQVDRTVASTVEEFDLAVAETELNELLHIIKSGELAHHAPFDAVPSALLRVGGTPLFCALLPPP